MSRQNLKTFRLYHSSLQWLLNFKNPEGQMARWLEVLASFDMVVQHRPGKKHANADALSRLPCKQCNHCNIPTPGLSDKESSILRIDKMTVKIVFKIFGEMHNS
jgi:hypothetical protein